MSVKAYKKGEGLTSGLCALLNCTELEQIVHKQVIVWSLSNSVFERRTSTGSASLGNGLVQTLCYIVFIREKKLSNTNVLASRHIYSEKASLPVDVCPSKTSLLKVPNRPVIHLAALIQYER